ncbi:MAG: hypothetical protein K2O24_03540 [Muribaculaceae bacterium]|nr:hypothetical protein [Muribaculaceae bacterium]
MASKTEYYDRIISSLQSDITSQKSEISDLKSTVASQQKEIEALKTSQDGHTQKSSGPQQKWITTENLLFAVKRACDGVIQANNEQLPTMFAARQEFQDFRKSIEQKFITADTFKDYKKSLETRLKSIEEKQKKRFSFLTIKRNIQTILSTAKSSFNPTDVIRFTKQLNLNWLIQILIFLSICLIAAYIYGSIKD